MRLVVAVVKAVVIQAGAEAEVTPVDFAGGVLRDLSLEGRLWAGIRRDVCSSRGVVEPGRSLRCVGHC